MSDVVVVSSFMDEQVLLHKDVSDGVVGKHAFNHTSNNLAGIILNKFLHLNLLETSWIASVMSVELLGLLLTTDLHL